ncbi:Uncharacterised protein [Vibrio cholerae]|nr:Uncharacterised protein [Vibrio cholerae]CSC09160.1 Uncharacterised protein [Vibrio cholerae]CSC17691.1 Uncharacterised protein [Vibrio cholerae]CSC35500.1 Uncharacterised protein [Vibrio cholerae]CSI67914.1 Uncharacterised protein [Vibrio cholerae]
MLGFSKWRNRLSRLTGLKTTRHKIGYHALWIAGLQSTVIGIGKTNAFTFIIGLGTF